MNETCFSCEIEHPSVEAQGIWYCPNALCRGSGGAWFRSNLDSYKDNGDGYHSVDEKEWLRKGKKYNKKNNINRDEFKIKY